MRIFGWDLSLSRKDASLDEIIRRLEAAYETFTGIAVTPENCEEAPTVQAIVNSISMRIATLPVHVLRKETGSDGRETKEKVPNHPVARLLQHPNEWQTGPNYWLDAASWIVRYGRFFAVKGQGATGPIRRLYPVSPRDMHVDVNEKTSELTFRVTAASGTQKTYDASEVHHARSRASDGIHGDSPVVKAREAIALEIAAQRFGGSFFGNGAMPSIVFKYAQGFKQQPKEGRDTFLHEFAEAYGKRGRFKAMLLPNGIEIGQAISVENEKAQFLETRKYQRTVIAGAFGVPPHLVGDLEKGTFNNVEQQSIEFQQECVLPYARIFESAMERDLLTDDDRRSGVVIRFNMDGALRGDFKTRQEGLTLQRAAGVISPNDWREVEGMNPIPDDDGGGDYWRQGPSGQSGEPTPGKPTEGAANDDAGA